MIDTGLVAQREGDPLTYDRFRNRVMFPIMDLRGKVIAFGGRAMSADVPAKYLNSPETELFHKRLTLYNGQMARDAAREMLRVMPKPPKKWDEPMPENGGERFWAHKLELWLPNPTPGWGSLDILEQRLSG